MEHRYELVDVFTTEPLAGNPLAVCLAGARVAPALRARIANELNLSETTFVLECPSERRARMEIFTPRTELPFAGHPTLGTAHVLARADGLAPGASAEWTLEQKAGPVAVRVRALDAARTQASFVLEREPRFGPPLPARDALAALLSLAPEELGERAACVSHGTPFLLVELASLEALARASYDPATRRARFAEGPLEEWTRKLYPFVVLAPQTPSEPARLRARMFAPLAGVAEDPATGSAAAALAALLARELGEGRSAATIEQGVELGRPSTLEIEATAREGRVLATRVGGTVVTIGSGVLELPG